MTDERGHPPTGVRDDARLAASLREEVARAEQDARAAEEKLNETAHALAEVETKLVVRDRELAKARAELQDALGKYTEARRALEAAQRELSTTTHRLVSAMQRRWRAIAPPGSMRSKLVHALLWPVRALLRKSR